MNDVVEFLQKRLAEKEEMLAQLKPWQYAEDIQVAIDGIKSAIASYTNQTEQHAA